MGAFDTAVETSSGFHKRLEAKISEQLASRRVGYLLGAGASFLGGKGYPLANQLWPSISQQIPEPQKSDIQRAIDSSEGDLESALDQLDRDLSQADSLHRRLVIDGIAAYFGTIRPGLEEHVRFLSRVARKPEHTVHLFNLNYDPLIELSSDQCRVRIVDGFHGIESAYFDQNLFQLTLGVIHRGARAQVFRTVTGVIHHYKLHGSLGWYECPKTGIRRCAANREIPDGAKRLMVPPQHRKITDTLAFPYEALWSEFRRLLRHGPFPLNRLAVIGYGMRDSHVNAVIDNALARPDFTLLVFAKELKTEVFRRWCSHPRAIIVTESQCSLYSEQGPGHSTMWDFARLSKEI